MAPIPKQDRFTAPWLFATAVFCFALAFLEKGLNLIGMSLPLTEVYPRQLLDWAVALLIFDIALTLRQLIDTPSGGLPREEAGLRDPGMN